MYNEIVPLLNLIRQMVENNNDKERILQYLDSTLPIVKIKLLDSDIKNCTACGLYPCNHVTFKGNVPADIMFIGEAPGEIETQQGVPFIGPAGIVFHNMLNSAYQNINPRWNAEEVFITNVIKCRPVDNNNNNRKPTIKEIATCKRYLDKEIEIVNPKLIICLGTTAAETIIHPKFKITEEHGKLFGEPGKLMYMAIYHPSYVLYKGEQTPEGVQIKFEMWEDLIKANEYLESIK